MYEVILPSIVPSIRNSAPENIFWGNDLEFEEWCKNPTWLRGAFTADKDHVDSILASKPTENILALAYFKSVYRHVHRNGLSYLASFSGPHRSGKSLSACLSAHLWDPTFWNSFEQRVVQSPFQFATTMKNIIDDEIIGAAVVIDEAGATFSSSDWYEKWMKIVHKFLQICGMLKPAILFVSPNREFIVAGMRKLLIAEHYLKRSDPEFSRMYCYHVKYNFMKRGDPYIFKRPIIRIAGQSRTLKCIKIYRPPKWFEERYKNLTEPDKKERMSHWTDEVHKVLAGEEEDIEPNYEEIIEDIWSKKEIFFGKRTRDGAQKIDQAAIEIHYKLKPKFAKYIKDRIERRLMEYEQEMAEANEELAQRKMEEMERQRKERKKELRKLPAEEKERMSEDLEDFLSSLKED